LEPGRDAGAQWAYGGPDGDAEEVATPTRQFSLLEITSGLPDDSREADERDAERRLRELRGRVKAARKVVSTTPGLAETLAVDWQKAARFCARFGVIERRFQEVAGAESVQEGTSASDARAIPAQT
jgi:hypothetical protein